MKYDILNGYNQYLKDKYCENTAKKYYASVKRIFEPLQFDTLEEVPRDYLEERLKGIKNKNDFSAAKRGLLLLKACEPSLNLPDSEFLSHTAKLKRNWTIKRSRVIRLKKIIRSVNQMSDIKKKLPFRLMLISGLRVSEIAALYARDVRFDNGRVVIHVRNGKGNKERTVKCRSDTYTTDKLEELVRNKEGDEPLFFKADTIMHSANGLGFECHDLRRAYAQLSVAEMEELTKEEGKKELQKSLGHSDYKTTEIYLAKRKINNE